MPRVSPALTLTAARIDKLLPLLLRECRDLKSSARELRWLREGLAEHAPRCGEDSHTRRGRKREKQLHTWVRRRSRGEPLQYILGNQPFGSLDIKCRPGVLIPRAETETYTEYVCAVLSKIRIPNRRTVRIADFCTGTGCIALELLSRLRPKLRVQETDLQIRGFDISKPALSLAKENLEHNIRNGKLQVENAEGSIGFEHLDVLALHGLSAPEVQARILKHYPSGQRLDVIVSNPPYISPEHFKPGGVTTSSVREHEPQLALVPPATLVDQRVCQADQFYVVLLEIAQKTDAKLLVMEVGDTAQALRVRSWCRRAVRQNGERLEQKAARIEIWKDDSTVITEDEEPSQDASRQAMDDERVECRAVVVWFDSTWIAQRGKIR